MDLALHLGMTAGGLSACMPESELRQWEQYARRRMLPMRRIEMYLSQVAKWCAAAAGATGAGGAALKIDDFLFDPIEQQEDDHTGGDEITADDAAAQFGGRVYRKNKD